MMLHGAPSDDTSPSLQTGGSCVLLTHTDVTTMLHENVLKNAKILG